MPDDTTQDPGSVQGRGADIMLPARGNPFEPEAPASAPEAIYAVGAEMTAEAAPPDMEAVAELVATAPVEMPASVEMSEPTGMPEPHDLSPEDLAAMFPSAHAEREVSPESLAPVTAEDLKSATAMGSDADLPGHDEAPMMDASAASEMVMGVAAAMSMAGGVEQPAQAAAAPAVAVVGVTTGSETVVAAAAAAPSVALPESFQLTDSVGVGLEKYKPGAIYAPKEELVRMFIPDAQLVSMWLDIDAVEKEIVSTPGISRKLAEQLLDRLAEARNKLMSDRGLYEEAVRQLAEVKYRLNRNKRASWDQQPRAMLVYLLALIVLAVIGFISTTPLSLVVGPRIAIQGFIFDVVWQSILWGGMGGVTGALYGLWKHVAAEEDYDPQFALWYYTNPIMGVVLGAFVYVLMQLALPAVFSGGTEGIQPSPYLMYTLAWAVGFQQNLAFSLVNSVLKSFMKMTPEGKDAAKK